MLEPLTADTLARRRARLLHAPWRRLARRLRQPQLRPGLRRTIRPQCARTARASRRSCTAEGLITAHQVHSATAVVAEHAWSLEERPRADAIVTATPGLAVGRADGRLRARAVRRPGSPRGRRRPCRLARRLRRGDRVHPCHHGKAGWPARARARRRRALHRPGRLRGGPRVRAGLPGAGRRQRPLLQPPGPGRAATFRSGSAMSSTACGRPASAASRAWRAALMRRPTISSAIGAPGPEKRPTTAAKSLPSP